MPSKRKILFYNRLYLMLIKLYKMINKDYRYEQGLIPSNDPNIAINELNGFFISHFLKLMYNTVDVMNIDNPAFSNGSGEKIFREFLLNEYGKVMSEKFHLTNKMMGRYFHNIKPDVSIDVST